jgi:lipopolysaccharide export LptBFGC system permease protein LptF
MSRPRLFGRIFAIVVVAMGIALSIVEPAFATVPVPAPIVGAGLPALAVLAGGYWLIRRLRERR